MEFPITRMRRLRRTDSLRRMVRETHLLPDQLIQPLFVVHGSNVKKPVTSMPGVHQLSVENVVTEAQRAADAGVPGIILFGIPDHKDADGSAAWKAQGIVQKAAARIKKAAPNLSIIADVCFCEYTDHGHCGVVEDGQVDNDATLENLAKQAVSLADAGVDVIAPSGMMDGMVGAIREGLDEADFGDIPILSYAVKYASAFYGPFREAAESSPAFGDRRQYQMDPANGREALREAALDVGEGADMLMVKPALAYLDVLRDLRDEFDLPLAAYNVSGEMAMVEAAAQNGWIDRKRIILETLLSMRRAGADIILTYWATEVAGWLKA
ncbi:MAG: porphobilinogen synthase [Deltaproteobacteria bacterium]|nr:porphobilinogen synthase [Deltaproteobacteria bacterium]